MRTLILAAALLLLLVPFAIHAQSRGASKRTKIVKDKLRTVKVQATQKRKEIKKVQVQRAEVREDLAYVNTRIRGINGRIHTTASQIRDRKAEQGRAASALEEASDRMEEVRHKARIRIRSMYVQGDQPRILTLLGAADAASFASRKALLERIAHRDRSLFVEMQERREQVAVRKRQVDRLVREVIALQSRLRDEQSGLMQAQDDKQSIIKGLNETETRLESELNELEQESGRLQNEIAQYQATSIKGSGSYVIPWHGGLLRPTNGRLTSRFGYRVHPISHKKKLHAGIDLASPIGTPIHAAAPGVVIRAGSMRGYGGTVVIDHGGGLSTLYGHCSRVLVRAGQRVSRGQTVALVGSTGYSTGPHCHFETRINGRPVNPLGRL